VPSFVQPEAGSAEVFGSKPNSSAILSPCRVMNKSRMLGSHDTIVVSWAFLSAALQIQQLDMSNLDSASGGRVLAEKNPRHKERVVATGYFGCDV
jgi:hypothetical protein